MAFNTVYIDERQLYLTSCLLLLIEKGLNLNILELLSPYYPPLNQTFLSFQTLKLKFLLRFMVPYAPFLTNSKNTVVRSSQDL